MNNLTERRRALLSSLNKSRLPEGYQEVAWLRGTGTQWCQTDFYASATATNLTEIYGDIIYLGNNSRIAIGSTWTDIDTYRYGITLSGDTVAYLYGEQSNEYTSFRISNYGSLPLRIHYELRTNKIIFNEHELSRPVTVFEQSTNPICIGALVSGSITDNNVEIMPLTIYNKMKNEILTEIIPCYRIADNKAGFYQTKIPTGGTHFLTNRSSGSDWVIGPVV